MAARVSAADVEGRLAAWKRGDLPSDAVEQWARAALASGAGAESEAVGAVLTRLTTMGRIDISREDVQVLEDALRAPDFTALLHRQFAGRGVKALPEGRVARSISTDPLLKARAKALRAVAISRHRKRNVLVFVLVVSILSGAAWLEWKGGYEGGAGFMIALSAGIVAYMLALGLFARIAKPPRCPFCNQGWETYTGDRDRGDAWRHIQAGRCPHCFSVIV